MKFLLTLLLFCASCSIQQLNPAVATGKYVGSNKVDSIVLYADGTCRSFYQSLPEQNKTCQYKINGNGIDFVFEASKTTGVIEGNQIRFANEIFTKE